MPTGTINDDDPDVVLVAAALRDGFTGGGLSAAYYRNADDALARLAAAPKGPEPDERLLEERAVGGDSEPPAAPLPLTDAQLEEWGRQADPDGEAQAAFDAAAAPLEPGLPSGYAVETLGSHDEPTAYLPCATVDDGVLNRLHESEADAIATCRAHHDAITAPWERLLDEARANWEREVRALHEQLDQATPAAAPHGAGPASLDTFDDVEEWLEETEMSDAMRGRFSHLFDWVANAKAPPDVGDIVCPMDRREPPPGYVVSECNADDAHWHWRIDEADGTAQERADAIEECWEHYDTMVATFKLHTAAPSAPQAETPVGPERRMLGWAGQVLGLPADEAAARGLASMLSEIADHVPIKGSAPQGGPFHGDTGEHPEAASPPHGDPDALADLDTAGLVPTLGPARRTAPAPRPTPEPPAAPMPERWTEADALAAQFGTGGTLWVNAQGRSLSGMAENLCWAITRDGDRLRHVFRDGSAIVTAPDRWYVEGSESTPAAAPQGAAPGWKAKAAAWLRDSEAYEAARCALDMPDGQDDATMDVLKTLACMLDRGAASPPHGERTAPSESYLPGDRVVLTIPASILRINDGVVFVETEEGHGDEDVTARLWTWTTNVRPAPPHGEPGASAEHESSRARNLSIPLEIALRDEAELAGLATKWREWALLELGRSAQKWTADRLRQELSELLADGDRRAAQAGALLERDVQ